MAPDRASTFHLRLSIPPLLDGCRVSIFPSITLFQLPLQTFRALTFPSGSSQNLLLCAGRALLVGPACAHACPCLRRGGRGATWAALASSPAQLHSCLSSPPPGLAREEPHRSHLCSCAVRKDFCVLRKKRQLKTL